MRILLKELCKGKPCRPLHPFLMEAEKIRERMEMLRMQLRSELERLLRARYRTAVGELDTAAFEREAQGFLDEVREGLDQLKAHLAQVYVLPEGDAATRTLPAPAERSAASVSDTAWRAFQEILLALNAGLMDIQRELQAVRSARVRQSMARDSFARVAALETHDDSPPASPAAPLTEAQLLRERRVRDLVARDSEAVRHIEKQISGLASVQQEFADCVVRQKESIEQLHALAVSSTQNVSAGESELDQARSHGNASMPLVGWALIILAIMLLLMHFATRSKRNYIYVHNHP